MKKEKGKRIEKGVDEVKLDTKNLSFNDVVNSYYHDQCLFIVISCFCDRLFI